MGVTAPRRPGFPLLRTGITVAGQRRILTGFAAAAVNDTLLHRLLFFARECRTQLFLLLAAALHRLLDVGGDLFAHAA